LKAPQVPTPLFLPVFSVPLCLCVSVVQIPFENQSTALIAIDLRLKKKLRTSRPDLVRASCLLDLLIVRTPEPPFWSMIGPRRTGRHPLARCRVRATCVARFDGYYRSSTSVASSRAERPSVRDRGKRDWGSNVSRADIAGRDVNSQLRRRLRSSRSIETTHLQTPSRKRTQRRVGPSSTTRLCSFRWRQAAPVGNESYLRNSSAARTQRAAAVETPRAGSHVHIVARILPFRRGDFNAKI
jgi:hypothetical protein